MDFSLPIHFCRVESLKSFPYCYLASSTSCDSFFSPNGIYEIFPYGGGVKNWLAFLFWPDGRQLDFVFGWRTASRWIIQVSALTDERSVHTWHWCEHVSGLQTPLPLWISIWMNHYSQVPHALCRLRGQPVLDLSKREAFRTSDNNGRPRHRSTAAHVRERKKEIGNYQSTLLPQ